MQFAVLLQHHVVAENGGQAHIGLGAESEEGKKGDQRFAE
jgi:hypothetical protein